MNKYGQFPLPVAVEKTAVCEPFLWRLTRDLVYQSPTYGTIIVPAKYETDFASVPRLLVSYTLFGNKFHEAATIHDWLYSTHGIAGREISRQDADEVLRHCILACGYSEAFARSVYLAVRVGGSGAWSLDKNLPQTEEVSLLLAAAGP